MLKNKQHETFCIELMKTGNKRKAALAAGCTEISAGTLGARWFKRVDVQNRLTELRDITNSADVLSIENRKHILSEVANTKNRLTNASAARVAILAIAELNRMDGAYAPEKREETKDIYIHSDSIEELKSRLDRIAGNLNDSVPEITEILKPQPKELMSAEDQNATIG